MNNKINNKNKVFIIMPFNERFDEVFKIIKKTFLELNYEIYRADEIYHTESIMDVIFKEIEESTIVIADVSGKSPNVNYELGISHALHKATIIIAKNRDDVPFDYQHRHNYVYTVEDEDWKRNLENVLLKYENELVKEGFKKVWKDPRLVQDIQLHEFLLRSYQSGGAILNSKANIISDDCGNVFVDQIREVIPKAHLSNIYFEIYIDKPGSINIESIYDESYGAELPLIIRDYNNKKIRFFILFRDLKSPGVPIRLKIKYKAENYFSDLFDSGEAISFHKNLRNSNVEYHNRREKISFQRTEKTEKISAKYIEHPNEDLRDANLEPILSKDYITFDVDFTGGKQSGFQVKFNLNE